MQEDVGDVGHVGGGVGRGEGVGLGRVDGLELGAPVLVVAAWRGAGLEEGAVVDGEGGDGDAADGLRPGDVECAHGLAVGYAVVGRDPENKAAAVESVELHL